MVLGCAGLLRRGIDVQWIMKHRDDASGDCGIKEGEEVLLRDDLMMLFYGKKRGLRN